MAAASPPSKLVETLTEYLAADESQVIALAERTQASLRQELQTFHDEVGRLASDVSEQQSVGHAVKEICDQLAHSMRTLHETDATHAERLEALQAETQRITGQLESLSAATRQQQGEVHTLRRVMDQIVERLNRHADVIRSLHELQKHLAAFLLGTRVISDQ